MLTILITKKPAGRQGKRLDGSAIVSPYLLDII